MREILFRGKRKDNGEWVEGFFCGGNERNTLHPAIFIYLPDKQSYDYQDIDINTLGQYTGLTDKNGTKIFEGDIIQNIVSGETGEIQYFPEHTAFLIFVRCSVIDSRCYLDYLGEVKPSILKVIGNIHDNPELLNK